MEVDDALCYLGTQVMARAESFKFSFCVLRDKPWASSGDLQPSIRLPSATSTGRGIRPDGNQRPRLGGRGQRRRFNTNPLPAENIQHELGGPIVLVYFGAVLVHLHVRQILVKEECAVHWAALSLGVELGREDGSGLVGHA